MVLSDFRKLTTTVLKECKGDYRDYRNFPNDEFRADLDNEILNTNIFLTFFIEILNKHAPIKIKYIRANQRKFMIKDLHNAITKRSRLRNKLRQKFKTEVSQKEYRTERNFSVNLLKKAKKRPLAQS